MNDRFPGNTVNKFNATINQNEPLPVAARIVTVNQVPAVQSDIASIERKVFRLDTGALVSTASLSVSAMIYDTLQSWDVDSVGYNFKDVIPASCFPSGAVVFDVEYTFTMAIAVKGPLHLVGNVTTLKLRS